MLTQRPADETPKPSRRDFLKTAGAGTAAAAAFGAFTLSAEEAQAASFDAEYDIVVVGGGGSGLPSALFSRWHGNKVLILEKAPRSAARHSRRPSGTGCRITWQ